MIVEICGLPGIGKSTVTKPFIDSKNIYGLRDCLGKRFYNNKKRDIIKFLYPKHLPKDYNEIISFLNNYPQCDEKFKDRLLFLYEALKRNDNSDKFFLLEEGAVQHITSLPHDMDISHDNTAEPVIDKLLAKEDAIIYFEAPIDMVYERIQKRNRSGDRFLDSNTDSAYKLLEIKKKNIESCLSKYTGRIYRLDMTSSANQCSDELAKIIKLING